MDFENRITTYKRNQGFLLVDDIGHRLMDDFAPLALNKVDDSGKGIDGPVHLVSPAAGALAIVAAEATEHMQQQVKTEGFDKGYDVTTEDRSNNEFDFRAGLGDLEFTWHFAPAVAATVVDMFKEEGHISSEEQDSLTLGDWANVMGSVWFGEAMHDLALTKNGLYGRFGIARGDYAPGALKKRLNTTLTKDLLEEEAPLFEVETSYEANTDTTYLTAQVDKGLRRRLRVEMKGSRASVGCPVARRAGTLPTELVQNNPHAQELIRRGDMVIEPLPDDTERVRFFQSYTPIHRALDGLALVLDRYDEYHGTPYIDPQTQEIDHQRVPSTNVLMRSGNIPLEEW